MEGQGCCKEKSAESCSTEKTGSCGDKTGGCGPAKGKCCPGTLLKGGLIGGIIIFAWFYLSWAVLPWHGVANAPHPAPDVLGECFAFCFVVSVLLTKILKKRKADCCPVAGSIVVGLLVALFNYVPALIWMHAVPHDALVGMADDLIAITLAGAAIGKCALGAGACTIGKCGDAAGSCKDDKGSCGTEKTGSCGDKKTSCH